MKTLAEIRQLYLDYFKSKGHEVVRSAPLLPQNDPSLLFVNAGMVQFKNYFTGKEKAPYKTAVSSQKCVRAGGKHNDLENVGYTARHHTFFEMLGNFSFGDYFKEDAIKYAWEFVTKKLGLPKEKLLVTIYHTDDEAFKLWKKIAKLPDEKIVRIDSSDNFWAMGDTGPCGPCSEIFYDHGEHIPGNPPGSGDEGDRFIEIWNLVFMQYEKKKDGTQIELPVPCIDTGMGLERVAAILQDKHNNFEIDLFSKLIEASQKLTKNKDPKALNHHRVIADHIRSMAFLIADGVLPSNEGRGYVLRRIIRRAIRHIHQLGFKGSLLSKLLPSLIAVMADHFEELKTAKELIIKTLDSEEEKFNVTLDRGLKLLDDAIKDLKSGGKLSGDVAFKLYDTYGFPLDLTQDILREKNISVDVAGFESNMQEQRDRAKENWQGSGDAVDEQIWFDLKDKFGSTKFLGYKKEQNKATIKALVQDGELVEKANSGEVFVIVDKTCFYAEAGGQIGDRGGIIADGFKALVRDTKTYSDGLIVHHATIIEGSISRRAKVEMIVDSIKRQKIRANHSATHLLHKALREVLGDHVVQKGSLVTKDLLRFDFAHDKSLKADEIARIEDLVNGQIRGNKPVDTREMKIEDAKKSGALALFGEKYADKVRVLAMGEEDGDPYSVELCGGTHVKRLGEIGSFKIISEGSIASGIRRIEALTAEAAFDYLRNDSNQIRDIALKHQCDADKIGERIEKLASQNKELNKKLSKFKIEDLKKEAEEKIEGINGIAFVALTTENIDVGDLRNLISQLQNKHNGVNAIFNLNDGKINVLISVDDALTEFVSANDLIKEVIPLIGGKGGGGKPSFAQGGGTDKAGIERAVELIKSKL